MLNVAFTFDYELFFGENNGTVEEILFSPTEELLYLLDKYNIKATFFVDVLSVYMHNKYNLNNYCEIFCKQIKKMIMKGHDVQLHIHSNWLMSKYKDGKWNFDLNSYRIHTFGFDDSADWSVQKIVAWGKKFLEDTLKPINQNYKCIAFRAGGYCIQPHRDLFKVLLNNGIYIDSSVAIGQKASYINEYDFTRVLKRAGWLIHANDEIENHSTTYENTICEIPVFYNKTSLFKRIFLPNTEKTIKLINVKGTYIGQKQQNKILNKSNKIKNLIKYINKKRLLSVDSLPFQAIIKSLKKEARKLKKNQTLILLL